MNDYLLKKLRCTLCGGELNSSYIAKRLHAKIEWGNLKCKNCTNEYPVVLGIPILMASHCRVDVKRNKIHDNLVKEGPAIKELVYQIKTGETGKIEEALLSPSLKRHLRKNAGSDKPVKNMLTRFLPKYLADKLDWRFYYLLKNFFIKLTFEDFRKHRKEVKLFEALKKESSAVGFLKLYFSNTKSLRELFYYFAHRFSQPRYLAGISLINLLPKQKEPILDLACGVGHFMHYLTSVRKEQPAIGLDRDFVSLYVAKKFVAPKGNFVCAEADLPLPFENETFSGVFCSDAFLYFSYRQAAVREIRRIASNDGVIILTRNENSLVHDYEGPEEITPQQFKNLFSGIPNILTGEEMILERYVNKMGPDLSHEQELKILNRMHHLSLIASNRNDIFIDHGTFDNWPHAVGNLQLNPLYKKVRQDNSGNVDYHYNFPSEWYEFENKDWLKYTAEDITLNSKVLEDLVNGTRSKRINDLIDHFVVFGMPNNYLELQE